MYVTIGGYDVTNFLDPDSVDFNASVSDPLPRFDCALDDTQLQLGWLDLFQEVIVWDENAPATYPAGPSGVPTIPSVNLLVNAILSQNGFGTSFPNWTETGTLPGSVWSYPYFSAPLTFANNALGYALQYQNTLLKKVVPGQAYMFSIYTQGSGTISNIQSIVKIDWYDAFGNYISTGAADYRTPALTQTHISVSAVAPANVAYAQVAFGGQTTVAGSNSGVITFGTPCFEPMWFADKGVSYPTPDCNFAQLNSVVLPDGTVSRACRIFGGYVEDLKWEYVGNQRFYTLQCAGLQAYAEDYALISKSYSSIQDTDLLSDVLTTYFSGVLAFGQQNYAAPASTLIPGTVIDQITFTDNTLREVSNGMSDTSGLLYYVDAYGYYNYKPPFYDISPYAFSDAPDGITSFPYESYTFEKDGTMRGNAIKVVGNKQNATAIQDTFSGNGSTTLFNLTKPPFNVHLVTIGGARQKTGVAGVDVLGVSGFVALINKQAQTIQFQGAPVSGTNNIVVEYTYEDAVQSLSYGADSIAQYGRNFYRKVNDNNLTSTAAATKRGLAELTKYAFGRQILNLTSKDLYVPVGSLVYFSSQHDSLARAPFTIQTVEIKPQGGGVYLFIYTLGAYNPTLLDHFRNLHKAVNRWGTTANVAQLVVTYDAALFDTVTWGDSVQGTPGTAGVARYNLALYGFSSYS